MPFSDRNHCFGKSIIKVSMSFPLLLFLHLPPPCSVKLILQHFATCLLSRLAVDISTTATGSPAFIDEIYPSNICRFCTFITLSKLVSLSFNFKQTIFLSFCSPSSSCASNPATASSRALELLNSTKKSRAQFNVDDLVSDLGKRPLSSHMILILEMMLRWHIWKKGPCQPHGHDFPRRQMGNDNRCFRKEWFSEFYWLEYSIQNDAAYCLHCYLFKPDKGGQGGGHIFTKTGFRDWKHKNTLKDHVKLIDSAHNQAFAKCTNLMNQKQRLPSRGHDESKESFNKGNLIELLNWYAARRKKINEVLFSNAPGNDQMTSPSIHKDLVSCCAVETTRSMINEMGDFLFSILVDESRDNSIKEQMTVVLRFVDKTGQVKERLLGISHIADTCAQSLKDAIDAMFSTHGLSISSLRGQGYDGASNMSCEFNSLKALILRENPCAMYVHYFAHQLQLAVVSVAPRNVMLSDLFNMLAIIVNLVGASCKRIDALRTSYHSQILERLNIEELSGGICQFQEMSLSRLGDTRWGSHLKTIIRFISMFNAIIDVPENISEDGLSLEQKSMAVRQMDTMQDFKFVFSLHFMFEILTITDDLSQALQKKDQDIQNAMRLLKLCKYALQNMRKYGWDTLLSKVIEFCVDRHISVPNMDDIVALKDSILQELHDRFPRTTTELFTFISCLSPGDSFAAFDVCKLVRLAQLYPLDFNSEELLLLRPQLDKFLMLVRMDEAFFNLKSISCAAQKLVEIGSSCYFSLVYRLITLVLILPVATASVERVFSTMNLIKNDLLSKMGDELLNVRIPPRPQPAQNKREVPFPLGLPAEESKAEKPSHVLQLQVRLKISLVEQGPTSRSCDVATGYCEIVVMSPVKYKYLGDCHVAISVGIVSGDLVLNIFIGFVFYLYEFLPTLTNLFTDAEEIMDDVQDDCDDILVESDNANANTM
ncbi:zinc finger MYM-type protein 1-like [Olea europaea var. sylvestris]|uniref:zinc finger MYM-type protein 1-like n=1 Tax=Olea europaea var. sylvestris TaxID=158386 RepID=UPI000C1D4E8C|nr:zinc finger MYM-type protein 1-like [Olea europaea var. sylvestris]